MASKINGIRIAGGLAFTAGATAIGIAMQDRYPIAALPEGWLNYLMVSLAGIIGVLLIVDGLRQQQIAPEIYTAKDGALTQDFIVPGKPMEKTRNVFRTKTGLCYVLPDKIVLLKAEAEALPNNTMGRNIKSLLMGYSIVAGGIFYMAYRSWSKGAWPIAVFFILFGIWVTIGIVRSLNHSATPMIDRQKIKQVRFAKGVLGITRSHFVVYFEENGQTKKRIIILPGSLDGGAKTAKKALAIMHNEGLLLEK